jgi:hypothetical protein
MRIGVVPLNNERVCSFSPEICLCQGKCFTASVLAQSALLSVGACGSVGLHTRTRALSSLFSRCSRFTEGG